MEHRWGHRREIHRFVRLKMRNGLVGRPRHRQSPPWQTTPTAQNWSILLMLDPCSESPQASPVPLTHPCVTAPSRGAAFRLGTSLACY
jgi:hypothetical protein